MCKFLELDDLRNWILWYFYTKILNKSFRSQQLELAPQFQTFESFMKTKFVLSIQEKIMEWDETDRNPDVN